MLGVGLALTSVGASGIGEVSGAALLLAGESEGLGLSFTDDYFIGSGHYGSARVKDESTQANNYNSHPFGLLTYSGASPKLCRGPSGSLRYGAHNLCLRSRNFTHATWTKFGQGEGSAPTIETGFPDPFGGNNASRITFDVGSGTTGNDYSVLIQNVTTSGFDNITRVYIRADAAETIAVRNPANDASYSTFNVTTEWKRFSTPSGAHATNSIQIGLRGDKLPAAGQVVVYLYGVHVHRTPADDTYLDTEDAPRYELPYEWDENGDLLGIRVEEQRTNLCLYSNMLIGAESGTPGTAPTGWTFSNADGTTNVVATGGTFGRGYIELSVANARHFFFQTIAVGANTSYTATVWVEVTSGTLQLAELIVLASNPAGATTEYLLDGVAATSVDTISADGNLHRAQMRLTVSDTSGDTVFRVGPGAGNNATGTVRLYHAQFEEGDFNTSPIETAGSTVTRAADNISLALLAFPSVANGGMAFADGTSYVPVTGDNFMTWLNIGSNADGTLLYVFNTAAGADTRISSSITGSAAVAASYDASGRRLRIATSFQEDEFRCAVNGAPDTTPDTSGALPTYSGTIQFGLRGTLTHLNGHLRGVIVLPTPKDQTYLDALSEIPA